MWKDVERRRTNKIALGNGAHPNGECKQSYQPNGHDNIYNATARSLLDASLRATHDQFGDDEVEEAWNEDEGEYRCDGRRCRQNIHVLGVILAR
jgi:hypothetical protein